VAIATIVVLGQLLSRQLRLSDVEASTLRSVGFSRDLTLVEPVVRSAFSLVIGAVGAVAIAYAASSIFPLDFVRRLEPDPGRRLDWLVLGLGPVVMVLAVLGWVAVSLRLDRPRLASRSSPGLVERIANGLPGGSATTAMQFSFGPRTGRTRPVWTSLAGLTVLFGVMTGAIVFGVNLRRLLDEPARFGMDFDGAIGVGEVQISPEVIGKLTASDDVAALTLYGETTVAVKSSSLDVVGMQQVKGYLTPQVRRGRLPETDDEVALGSVTAEQLGLHVGDSLTVSAPSGPRTLHVTGIVVVPSVGGVDGLGKGSAVTSEGFAALDPDAAMNTATLRLPPGAPAGAADRVGELLGSRFGLPDRPSSILNLQRVRAIPFLVAGAVGALAVISLGHLMIVTVRRRRRDLAVLLALGASRRWVSAVVQWQATIVTAAVLALALPLGAAAGSAVYRRFIDPVGVSTDTVQPVVWLGIALLAVILAANIVAAVPAARARRIAPARMLTGD
jgi:FtsX-like permease family